MSELIDKFIIANPRIEPIKDKSYVPNDDISKPLSKMPVVWLPKH